MRLTDRDSNKSVWCLVGDRGPDDKTTIDEVSIAAIWATGHEECKRADKYAIINNKYNWTFEIYKGCQFGWDWSYGYKHIKNSDGIKKKAGQGTVTLG